MSSGHSQSLRRGGRNKGAGSVHAEGQKYDGAGRGGAGRGGAGRGGAGRGGAGQGRAGAERESFVTTITIRAKHCRRGAE